MDRSWWLVSVIGVLACTSSQKPAADVAQAATLDQQALAASGAAERYGQAAAAAATPADCAVALQPYVAGMQPLLEQMAATAGSMDSFMKSSGDAMAGDMECVVQEMSDELAHHQASACSGSDMAANHAEAERDTEAMLALAAHLQMRAVQAGGMMTDGGTTTGGQDAGWMMGWSDAGLTMADGGMMSFGQSVPGCTYGPSGYQAPDGGYWLDGGWVMGPAMMDGGTMMDAGTMMDGGTMTDGGTMMDGGTGDGGAMMDGGMGARPPSRSGSRQARRGAH